MGQTNADFTRKKPHVLVEGAYDFVEVRDVARGLVLAEERGRTGDLYILSGAQIRLAQIRDTV
jgi:dihydroflavonol-4-reductase